MRPTSLCLSSGEPSLWVDKNFIQGLMTGGRLWFGMQIFLTGSQPSSWGTDMLIHTAATSWWCLLSLLSTPALCIWPHCSLGQAGIDCRGSFYSGSCKICPRRSSRITGHGFWEERLTHLSDRRLHLLRHFTLFAWYLHRWIPAGSTQSMPSRKWAGRNRELPCFGALSWVLFFFFKDRKAASVHGGRGVHRL